MSILSSLHQSVLNIAYWSGCTHTRKISFGWIDVAFIRHIAVFRLNAVSFARIYDSGRWRPACCTIRLSHIDVSRPVFCELRAVRDSINHTYLPARYWADDRTHHSVTVSIVHASQRSSIRRTVDSIQPNVTMLLTYVVVLMARTTD